jgi:hypothetical protein
MENGKWLDEGDIVERCQISVGDSAHELGNGSIATKYMYNQLRQMDKNIVNTEMYENVNIEMYL